MNQELPTNSGISKKTKKIIFGIIVLIICVPIFWVVFIFIDFCYVAPSQILHEADAGFRKAKETIDPEQLRLWALQEIPKYSHQTNNSLQIPNSEIPSYLQKLYPRLPEDAWLQKDGEQNYVQIFWGGALFHWTLEIGSTNFVPPKDSEVTTVEWIPGIYYNREDTRHPFK